MNASKKTGVLGIDSLSVLSVVIVAACLALSLPVGKIFNPEKNAHVTLLIVFTYYWPALIGGWFFGRFLYLMTRENDCQNFTNVSFLIFGLVLAALCVFLCYHITLRPMNRGPSPINRFFRGYGNRYHVPLQVVYIAYSAVISLALSVVAWIVQRARSVA